jgi:hypothetical protein
LSARAKDGDDGEEVFGQLLVGASETSSSSPATGTGAVGAATLAFGGDHDAAATRASDVLHELEGKAAEAVAVGNHNFFDASTQDAVQKGPKGAALPVDARPNVGEAGVRGGVPTLRAPALLEAFEGVHLALEVALLLGRGDSCVEDRLFRFPATTVGVGVPECGPDVLLGVEVGATGGKNEVNFACIPPAAQRGRANFVELPDGCRFLENHTNGTGCPQSSFFAVLTTLYSPFLCSAVEHLYNKWDASKAENASLVEFYFPEKEHVH